jgi:putative nucleotidyltransferase with HDIG domain
MRLMRKLLSSLRIRLILLVLLALLPVFGLALYDRYDQRQQSARAAQIHALEIARRAVIDQRELIGAAHQLLLPLAQLQGARDQSPIPCSTLFDELLRQSTLYANLGVLDARGNVVCAGVMPEQPLNLGARPYFARVLQQPSVTLGEFEIGVITGAPTINFALPIVDDAQQVQGAVFASLNQTWLRGFADEQKMPADSTLVLVERNNALGIRYPDLQVLEMRALTPAQIAEWFSAPDTQRIVEIQDSDGVTRLYAFVPLSLEGYLGIGLASAIVYGEIDYLARRDLILLILVTVLALCVAWLYSDWFITRRVRTMLDATRRLEAGDLSARTDQAYGSSELSELARAFDQMAATLQQRAAEQKNAVEALRQQAEEFATITQLSRQVSSVSDLNQVLTVIARASAELAQSDASGVYIPEATGNLRLVVGHGVSRAFIESLNTIGIRANEGALGRAMIERRPIQISDTNEGYDFPFSAAVRAEGIRAILAVPMLRDDRVTGGIVLWHHQPRQFAPSEVAFLQAVAQQCVNAVENARLLQAERDARTLAEALRDTATALGGTLDFDELLDRILENVERVVPHDSVNIMLLEKDRARIVRSKTRVAREDWQLCRELVIADAAEVRRVIETRQPLLIEDAWNDPDWIRHPESQWIRSHIIAPICAKDKLIGLLNLDSAVPGFFTAAHLAPLQAFTGQAALALENARLLIETAKRASHFAALSETARDIAIQQDLTALLETIVERAMMLLGVAHSSLFLYDATRRDLELVVQKGQPLDVPLGARWRLGEGMAGRVAQAQQPLTVNNYSAWEHRSPQLTHSSISAVLQVPLLYRGELIGVLSVTELGAPTRQFTDEDTRLLGLLASQAAGAVHNTRLLHETHTRAEQLALLYDAGLALNSILEPQTQLEYLLKIARRALKADCVSFFRYDAGRAAVIPELCIGFDAEGAARWHRLQMRADDETIPGWIATHRLPVNLADVSGDPRYIAVDPKLRSGLWMPIEREQRLLGILGMLSARVNAFPAEAERLLALFANQAAVALENARLFSETQASLLILTRLYNLSSQMLIAASVSEIAQLATGILRDSFAATAAWVHLFNSRGEREFSYGIGLDSNQYGDLTPRPQGFSAQVWRSGKHLVVTDPALIHPVARAYGTQSAIVVPLRDDPVNLGVLYLDYATLRAFSEREIDLLSLFANQVALAIKRVRLTAETRHRADQLTILNRIASAINQPTRLDDLLRVLYREIIAALPCDAFFIALYDPVTSELDYRFQIDEGVVEKPQRRTLKTGLSWHVVKNRQPLLVRDRANDPRFPPSPETLWGTMKHARSWLGVPILLGDAVVGIVSVQSYTANTYDKEEEQFLVTIADQVAVAIQRARLDEETQQRLVELEAMNEISSALRAALTSREMLPSLLDATLRAFGANAGLAILYDWERTTPSEIAARGWFAEISHALAYSREGIVDHAITTGQAYIAREFRADPLTREHVRAQIPPGWGGICTPIRTTQGVIGVLIVSVPLPRTIQPNEARLLLTIAEMAGNAIHRATLHEQTERHVRRLNALHTIDTAISASLDLRVTLNILLDQTVLQLGADAANILTLDPITQTLEVATGQGFRTNAPPAQHLHLGEGSAAPAVLEHRITHHADLSAVTDPRAEWFAAEGFVTYYAAPLISKGQFKGVLEIFQRAPHQATTEWLGFLDTLAGQTAIAIELATLFTSLQRSNLELAIAYDSTIEGWSHILDLRDRETEGHTQRVAELTVRLARGLGVLDAELMNVRRGALLHDIGKMAVPDRILLKRGRLTKTEMQKMRQHPQFAKEMLSSIEYLRGALDIPYCHHERWDGAGYPRGLKGEEIPLSARIFAVVDVWDALCSKRPYRRAWRSRRVQAYLKAQAGSHFDPRVVEIFLRMIQTDEIAQDND